MPRCVILWLLILALPVYGGAGALLQMLGPVHRHEVQVAPARSAAAEAAVAAVAVGAAAAWLADNWQAWKAFAHRQAHAGLLGHDHHHDAFERHHHAAIDDGVVVLGAGEGSEGSAPDTGTATVTGSANLPMGLPTAWQPPPALATGSGWPGARETRWRSADPRRRDRPPQV